MAKNIVLLNIFLITVCSFPVSGFAQERKNYISHGTGLVLFADEIKDHNNLSWGFNGEFAYGRYFHQNFSLELGTAYFHDGRSPDDIRGVPILFTGKAVYPLQNTRFYAGAGIGYYGIKFDGTIDGVEVDGTDRVFGGHLLAGIEWDFRSPFFVGVEGKYIVTEDVEFDNKELGIEMATMMVKVGYRF